MQGDKVAVFVDFAVKELVICGLLISARKVYPAMEWVQTLKGEGDAVPKLVEQGSATSFSTPSSGIAL